MNNLNSFEKYSKNIGLEIKPRIEEVKNIVVQKVFTIKSTAEIKINEIGVVADSLI